MSPKYDFDEDYIQIGIGEINSSSEEIGMVTISDFEIHFLSISLGSIEILILLFVCPTVIIVLFVFLLCKNCKRMALIKKKKELCYILGRLDEDDVVEQIVKLKPTSEIMKLIK